MTSTTTRGLAGSRRYRLLGSSLCLLMLVACSGEAESPPVAQADVAGAAASGATGIGVGVLETSGGAYKFTPTLCAFHKEDGVDDVEIHGPGQAPDGEKFYFEFSSQGNEMIVKLGADGQFESPERRLVAGMHVSEAFDVNVSGKSLTVPRLVLKDGQGEQVDDNASLQIDCNA